MLKAIDQEQTKAPVEPLQGDGDISLVSPAISEPTQTLEDVVDSFSGVTQSAQGVSPALSPGERLLQEEQLDPFDPHAQPLLEVNKEARLEEAALAVEASYDLAPTLDDVVDPGFNPGQILLLANTFENCFVGESVSEDAACLANKLGIPAQVVASELPAYQNIVREVVRRDEVGTYEDLAKAFAKRFPEEARVLLRRPNLVQVAVDNTQLWNYLKNQGLRFRAWVGSALASDNYEAFWKQGEADYYKNKADGFWGEAKKWVPKESVSDGAFDSIWRRLKAGELQLQLAEEGEKAESASRNGDLDSARYHLANVAEIKRQMEMTRPSDDGYLMGLVGEGLESAIFSWEALKAGGLGSAAGAVVGGAIGLVGGPAGAVSGAIKGATLGAVGATAAQEYNFQRGLNFADYASARTDDGRLVDIRDASKLSRRAASWQAGVSSLDTLATVVSLGASKLAAPAVNAAKRVLKREAKEELTKKATANVAKNVTEREFAVALSSTHKLRTALSEGVRPFLTSAGGEAVEEIAQDLISGYHEDDLKEWNSVYEQNWEIDGGQLARTGVVAALGSFGFSLGAGGVRNLVNGSARLAAEYVFREESAAHGHTLGVLAAQAKTKSKDVNRTIAREFGEAIRPLSQAPIKNVSIDPRAAAKFFEEQGKSAFEEIRNHLGEKGLRDFVTAAEAGDAYTVSFETFYADFSDIRNADGTTLAEYLAPKAWIGEYLSLEEVQAATKRDEAIADLLQEQISSSEVSKETIDQIVELYGASEKNAQAVPTVVERANAVYAEKLPVLVEALKGHKNITEEQVSLVLKNALAVAAGLEVKFGATGLVERVGKFDILGNTSPENLAAYVEARSAAINAEEAARAGKRGERPPAAKKDGDAKPTKEKAPPKQQSRIVDVLDAAIEKREQEDHDRFVHSLAVHPNSGALSAEALLDKIDEDTPVTVFDLEGKKFLNDVLGHEHLDDYVRRLVNVVHAVAPNMTAQSSTSVYAVVTPEQIKALQEVFPEALDGLGVTVATTTQREAREWVEIARNEAKAAREQGKTYEGEIHPDASFFGVLDGLAKMENNAKIARGERTRRKAPPSAWFNEHEQERLIKTTQERLEALREEEAEIEARPSAEGRAVVSAEAARKEANEQLQRALGERPKGNPKMHRHRIERLKARVSETTQQSQNALAAYYQTLDGKRLQAVLSEIKTLEERLSRLQAPIDWDAKPPHIMAVATELGLDVDDPAVQFEFRTREENYLDLSGKRDEANAFAKEVWADISSRAKNPVTHDEPRIEGIEIHPKTLERISGMTRKQQREKYFMKDGVLSWLGQQFVLKNVTPVAFMSGDMSGLFDLNESLGRDGADEVLGVVREALLRVGGDNLLAFHLHGDEMGAMVDQGFLDEQAQWGKDRAETGVEILKDYTKRLVEQLGNTKLYYRNEEKGTFVIIHGVGFQYGFGETFDKADVDIKEQNKARPGGKPFVQRLEKGPNDKHEPRPEGIASRIEVFHGLTPKQEGELVIDLHARGFSDLLAWQINRGNLWSDAANRSGVTGRPEAAKTTDNETHSEGVDSGRDMSEPQEAVGSGAGGHRGAVLSTDERRDAPDGRTDTERSVAGAESADHGASGRVDEKERVLFKGTKGAVRVGLNKETNTRLFQIALDENADVETFLHEVSHIMLQQIVDYAKSDKAPRALQDEVDQLAEYLGFDLGEEIPTEAHEKWADSLAGYLLKGERPNNDSVVDSMERLKDGFLKPFYTRHKNVNVDWNDDLWQFFETMFAVDEKFKEVARISTGEPLGQQVMGLSPEEFEEYLRAYEDEADKKLRSKERSELNKRLSEIRKTQVKEKKKLVEEEKKRIEGTPGYRWRLFLRDHSIKLSKEETLQYLPHEENKLPPTMHGVTQADKLLSYTFERLKTVYSGVGLEFGSAKEFYEAISNAPTKSGLERRATDYANKVLSEGTWAALNEEDRAIRERLSQTAFSAKFMRAKMTELAARAKTAGKVDFDQEIRITQLKAAAESLASKITPNQANHKKWLAKAKRAGTVSFNAMKPTDTGRSGVDAQKAFDYKEEELFALFVANEIYNNQQASAKYKVYLTRLGTEDELKRIGHIDQGVTEGGLENFGRFYSVVASLLESVGLKKRPKQGIEFEQRSGLSDLSKAIEELDKRRAEHGLKVNIKDAVSQDEDLNGKNENDGENKADQSDVLKNANMEFLQGLIDSPRSWEKLSFGEQKQLREFLGQIAHLKRVGRMVWLDGRAYTLNEVRDIFDAAIPDRSDENEVILDNTQRTAGDKARDVMETMRDYLTERTAFFKNMGKFGEIIFQTLLDAEVYKNKLGNDILNKLEKEWFNEKHPGLKRAREKFVLPEDMRLPEGVNRKKFSRRSLLMMAMNVGNESNMQRLVDGFGGAERGWTPERVMQLLNDNLTDDEWRWVQAGWDLLQELQPLTAKVFQSMNGTPMAIVEARPFKTKSGLEMRGGYYPLFYNKDLSKIGGLEEQTESEFAKFSINQMHLTTSQRHVKKRVEKVFNAPLDLNSDPIHGVIASMIHYISHEEATRHVSRILSDDHIRKMITTRLGAKTLRTLQNVLKEFANGVDPIKLEGFVSSLSRVTILAVLGFSIAPALGDIPRALASGLKGKVGMRYVLSAYARAPQVMALAKQKSGAWNLYNENASNRFLSAREQVDFNQNFIGKVQKKINSKAFVFLDYSSKYISAVIWDAKYHEVLGKGGTEEEAIRQADSLLIEEMPTTVDWMKADFQNQFVGRAIFVFASEFVKLATIALVQSREVRAAWKAGDKLGAITTALRSAFGVATLMLLGAAFMGQGKGDDEEIDEWMLRTALSNLAGVEPFLLKPLVNDAVVPRLFGKRGTTPQVPIIATGKRVAEGINSIWRSLEEDRLDKSALLDLAEVFGPIVFAPTNVLSRTLSPLFNDKELDGYNDLWGAMEAFAYGRKKERAWNAFRFIQARDE